MFELQKYSETVQTHVDCIKRICLWVVTWSNSMQITYTVRKSCIRNTIMSPYLFYYFQQVECLKRHSLKIYNSIINLCGIDRKLCTYVPQPKITSLQGKISLNVPFAGIY